jgi:Colicin V production protein
MITLADLFLLIILFAMIFWCFVLGTMKVLTMILGMYFGLQVAALTYGIFASLTADKTSASLFAHQNVWFGVLWLLWAVLFGLILWQFIKSVELPKGLANLDQIGGLILGAFAALFVVMVVGLVFKQVFAIVVAGSQGRNEFFNLMSEQFNNSIVIQVVNTLKVVFFNILSPWLPVNQLPLFSAIPR